MWRFARRTFYINSLWVIPLFGMSRGAKMSLALNEPKEVEAPHSDLNTTSEDAPQVERNLLIFNAKQPMENHRGPIPDEKSH